MSNNTTRRGFLKIAAILLAGSTAFLAGCPHYVGPHGGHRPEPRRRPEPPRNDKRRKDPRNDRRRDARRPSGRPGPGSPMPRPR